MPAHYAHYRFGKQILAQMPADVKRVVQRFRRMFDMGLQGPDIFFYYNPFLKTAIGDLGHGFHCETGREFFGRVCAVAKTEPAKAYLYGVLAHYCLDSVCHPYVGKIVDIGEAGHVAFESEFERYLLVLDKEPSPHTYDLSSRMKLTRGECETVAEFYPPSTGGNVRQSIRFMAFATKFLANPNREKTVKWLKRLKPGLCDHLIPMEENEELALYVNELYGCYNRGLEKYPDMLEQLLLAMQTGEALGADFERDFG